ncbi:hypothetical protein PR048_017660 [Dryococelus australis]|uniref:Uncharacterized protein n=1 Tax=Dryococelus australis TaxID=614101 RepID=A0ABQ9HA38_9NEOP|nr:hypothetical protein PR048_017660 [Dryococelus australis]
MHSVSPKLHGGYWLLMRAPGMYSSEQAPAYLATVHHTPLSPPSALTHSRLHSPGFTPSRPFTRALVRRRGLAPNSTRALSDGLRQRLLVAGLIFVRLLQVSAYSSGGGGPVAPASLTRILLRRRNICRDLQQGSGGAVTSASLTAVPSLSGAITRDMKNSRIYLEQARIQNTCVYIHLVSGLYCIRHLLENAGPIVAFHCGSRQPPRELRVFVAPTAMALLSFTWRVNTQRLPPGERQLTVLLGLHLRHGVDTIIGRAPGILRIHSVTSAVQRPHSNAATNKQTVVSRACRGLCSIAYCRINSRNTRARSLQSATARATSFHGKIYAEFRLQYPIVAPSQTAFVTDRSSLNCETASIARRSPTLRNTTHRTIVEPALRSVQMTVALWIGAAEDIPNTRHLFANAILPGHLLLVAFVPPVITRDVQNSRYYLRTCMDVAQTYASGVLWLNFLSFCRTFPDGIFANTTMLVPITILTSRDKLYKKSRQPLACKVAGFRGSGSDSVAPGAPAAMLDSRLPAFSSRSRDHHIGFRHVVSQYTAIVVASTPQSWKDTKERKVGGLGDNPQRGRENETYWYQDGNRMNVSNKMAAYWLATCELNEARPVGNLLGDDTVRCTWYRIFTCKIGGQEIKGSETPACPTQCRHAAKPSPPTRIIRKRQKTFPPSNENCWAAAQAFCQQPPPGRTKTCEDEMGREKKVVGIRARRRAGVGEIARHFYEFNGRCDWLARLCHACSLVIRRHSRAPSSDMGGAERREGRGQGTAEGEEWRRRGVVMGCNCVATEYGVSSRPVVALFGRESVSFAAFFSSSCFCRHGRVAIASWYVLPRRHQVSRASRTMMDHHQRPPLKTDEPVSKPRGVYSIDQILGTVRSAPSDGHRADVKDGESSRKTISSRHDNNFLVIVKAGHSSEEKVSSDQLCHILSELKTLGSVKLRYTQSDENTARQFRALCLEVLGHVRREAVSPLGEGASVAERIVYSPPTNVIRVQFPAVSPDPRVWESCRTMSLIDGSSRGSPASPAPPPPLRRRSILTSITIIGSQDLASLVHTVFDASWKRLAQSSPSTVTADSQNAVDISTLLYKTAESSLQIIELGNSSGLYRWLAPTAIDTSQTATCAPQFQHSDRSKSSDHEQLRGRLRPLLDGRTICLRLVVDLSARMARFTNQQAKPRNTIRSPFQAVRNYFQRDAEIIRSWFVKCFRETPRYKLEFETRAFILLQPLVDIFLTSPEERWSNRRLTLWQQTTNVLLISPMRLIDVSMERHRNERAGEMGDSRDNQPTNGIVRHDSHLLKFGDPRGGG